MLNDLFQNLNPVAFSIGPFSVRWYGIAYIVGFICAGLIMMHLTKRWKIRFNSDALFTIFCCVIVGIILGARLGYCIFYGNGYYWAHPLEFFLFNQGGMSFHGGLMGAFLSAILAAKFTGIPYLTLADLGAIGAPIGLFLGRCANFVNGELWGDYTNLPWGVVFGGEAGSMPRHPSQLYEALLEGVILFVILFILSRKLPPRPRGTFIGCFLVLYGCFRFLIEFIRQPDAQIGYLWGEWLTMGQVLSVPLIFAGIGILIYVTTKKMPQLGLPEPTASISDSLDPSK